MIEDIIIQHGTRGIQTIVPFLPPQYCSKAATQLYNTPKGNIFILTGFAVNGKGETDGPMGSYFLLKALQKLGFTPYIITDTLSYAYFKSWAPCILYTHHTSASYLLHTYSPVAIISIERCGRYHNGRYYNMRKKDISALTPPIDDLILHTSALTIGIGDGGNEIGMGNVLAQVSSLDIIPSTICCHHLIAATVSNWGAYGLIAALEHLSHIDLLPSATHMEQYLQHLIRQGAVDGISGKNIAKIDGYDPQTEYNIVSLLQQDVLS